jgi:hypothetical protein
VFCFLRTEEPEGDVCAAAAVFFIVPSRCSVTASRRITNGIVLYRGRGEHGRIGSSRCADISKSEELAALLTPAMESYAEASELAEAADDELAGLKPVEIKRLRRALPAADALVWGGVLVRQEYPCCMVRMLNLLGLRQYDIQITWR